MKPRQEGRYQMVLVKDLCPEQSRPSVSHQLARMSQASSAPQSGPAQWGSCTRDALSAFLIFTRLILALFAICLSRVTVGHELGAGSGIRVPYTISMPGLCSVTRTMS